MVKGNQYSTRQCQLDGSTPRGLKSDLFGDDLKKLGPLIEEGQSDSASFDNALEPMVQSGYSLPHAMMTLIP